MKTETIVIIGGVVVLGLTVLIVANNLSTTDAQAQASGGGFFSSLGNSLGWSAGAAGALGLLLLL